LTAVTNNKHHNIQKTRRLVHRYGRAATCWQILDPSLAHWFCADENGVVGYATFRRVRVVAGEPVCAPERLAAVVREFERDAARSGERVCYLAAERPLAECLMHTGRHAVAPIGAQPVWHPAALEAAFEKVAALRYQISRARNKKLVVAEWSSETADKAGLDRCLAAWLRSKPLPPLGFMTNPYLLQRLDGRRLWVASQAPRPVGYAALAPVPARRGWLVEQIVRCPGAPNGTAESLVAAVARDVAAEGSRFITLGAAPLSRRGPQLTERPPWWFRATAGWMRAHGTRFYNFRGLEHFKAKFRPQAWEPVFAVAAEPRIRPATLYAVMGAFTGRSPFVAVGQAAAHGLLDEIRRRPRHLSHRRP
jgi:phosphatidylglycerol lysyltransferase